MSKFNLLKPEALGFLQSDLENPEFQFSLDGVDEETIKSYLDNNIIEYADNQQ